jgi:anthraniloyl-CoA monooxygenase
MEAVDHRFGQPQNESRPPLLTPPPWLTPLRLRQLTLANRVVVTPPPAYEAVDGTLSAGQQRVITDLAGRGAALLLTEPVAISADGRITPGDAGLYAEQHGESWAQLVTAAQQQGTAVALQLNHAGRRGATRPRGLGLDRPLPDGAWPLLGPSALPYHPRAQTPKAMAADDMTRALAAFERAAAMAQAAGFALLQLNMAHGYLLGSFLSPLTNKRTDEYGGSLENRLRYPLAVLSAVRAVWPASKPLSVAINATDWAENGITPETAVSIAQALKDHGCDLLELRAGQTVPGMEPAYGPGFLTPFSDHIRHEADLPTLIGGFLRLSGEINAILAAGRADLCIMEVS